MPWYLYLALKQLFPSGKRFPLCTAISVLGVGLGVMVLIIALAVMGGFGQAHRELIINTQGEIQVRWSGALAEPEPWIERLNAMPDVVAATPFAEGVVMLQIEGRPAFPGMQGIDLERVENVTPLTRFIVAGDLDELDDDSIVLSSKLAMNIGARLGSDVEVFSPLMLEKLKNDEVLLPRELRVVGIFEIGHHQLDSSVVIVPLRLMQDLYGLGGGVHGINLKLRRGADAELVAREINATLPFDARAITWIEVNHDFLYALQMEKNMMFFLLLFIVVVAAFSVTSSLLIAVVRKTREIGLLGALGASPRQIGASFCFQGLFIGTAGTLLGIALGFAGLALRNDIVNTLARLTGGEDALANVYQFSQMPAHLSGTDFVTIVVSTITISTLAGLLPAWRAARLNPVEALRNE